MTPHDYEFLCRLLKARSGLMLSAEKHYLVESRLLPVARKHGLFNITGLVSRLRAPDAETFAVEAEDADAVVEFELAVEDHLVAIEPADGDVVGE